MRWNWLVSFHVMLAVLAVGCSGPSDDPWAETELSRAAAEGSDPERHLGIFSPKPNLYDLHAPRGALAIASDREGRVALRILEAAGLPAQMDPQTAVTTYGGEPRQLWMTHDRTRAELPVTRMRVSLPPKPGVISITDHVRVSDGQEQSMLIRSVDISTFAAQFASRRGAGRSEPTRTRLPGAPPQEVLVVGISEGSLTVGGTTMAPEDLLDEVTAAAAADKPVLLWPTRGARYADVVAVLDQLHRAAARGLAVRFLLPSRAPGERLGPGVPVSELRSDLTEPVLVLKADAELSYEKVDAVLDHLRGILDQVVLLTRLDISDPSLITAETWPGGLPGGIVLPLGSADDSQLADIHDLVVGIPDAPP